MTERIGLFVGAGFSHEAGMPLVWELTSEIKNWLTPDKLRSLNAGWRAQGTGHSDEVIEDLASVLQMDQLHYENILGYLEVQSGRQRPATRKARQRDVSAVREGAVQDTDVQIC